MPKKADVFVVFGTADYFKDRDRLPRASMYALDKKEVSNLDAAVDIAKTFMFQNKPMGPRAYVAIEQKIWYRGGWDTNRVARWENDGKNEWKKA